MDSSLSDHPPPNTNQTKIATQMMTMTSRTATIAITYLSGELSEIGRFSPGGKRLRSVGVSHVGNLFSD